MNERSSIDASRRLYKNTTSLLVPRLHIACVHGPRALANIAQMISGEQLCPSFEHCAKEVCLHKKLQEHHGKARQRPPNVVKLLAPRTPTHHRDNAKSIKKQSVLRRRGRPCVSTRSPSSLGWAEGGLVGLDLGELLLHQQASVSWGQGCA